MRWLILVISKKERRQADCQEFKSLPWPFLRMSRKLTCDLHISWTQGQPTCAHTPEKKKKKKEEKELKENIVGTQDIRFCPSPPPEILAV